MKFEQILKSNIKQMLVFKKKFDKTGAEPYNRKYFDLYLWGEKVGTQFLDGRIEFLRNLRAVDFLSDKWG